MYIKPTKIVPIFLRNGIAIFFILTLIGIMISTNFDNVVNPYSYDEQLYKNSSNNFTLEHITYLYENILEIKPLTFLTLQKVLNNSDPNYTRGLSYILIFLSTILIYKITNNRLAYLYVLIPIF
jgi:hypothetical protein